MTPRRIRVRMLLDDKEPRAMLYPVDYIGGAESFQAWRRATEGATYVRERKINLAPFDRVGTILHRLRQPVTTEKEGSLVFDVSVDPKLRENLYAFSAQQWLDYRSAEARIEQTGKELSRVTGLSIFPYQKTGALELAVRRSFLLADDMGLGKTVQAIAAFPSGAPVLVVGTSIAKLAWASELRKWRPNMTYRVLSGRGSFRWPAPNESAIINYDVLPNIHLETCDGKLPHPPKTPCLGCKEVVVFLGNSCTTRRDGHEDSCTGWKPQNEDDREDCPGCARWLTEAPPGLVVVFDEAHKIKNSESLRGQRCRAISRSALAHKDGRVWMLTGTPMENSPKELWSVLSVGDLAREAFGSWQNMVTLFGGEPKTIWKAGQEIKAGYDWSKGAVSSAEVATRLQRVMLRRMKADVLPQLPGKMWRIVEVPINKQTMLRCESFLKANGGADGIADRLDELLAHEGTPKFQEMSRVREALATAKIPALLELVQELEELGQPVLVFSMHKRPIEELEKRRGWGAIHGGLAGESGFKKRQQIVERFQAGHMKGLALTIQAGGEALTLTRANQVIFVDLAFKPSANEQAEDRACRIGQTKGVVVTILAGEHPLDRRVTEILHAKRKIIAASVDAATKTDDAPARQKEIEDRLRLMQEEIASGRALRRIYDTEEERLAIDTLASGAFDAQDDERLARDLAEQAAHVGLSVKQWALAVDVAKRAIHAPPTVWSALSIENYLASEKNPSESADAGQPAEDDATKDAHADEGPPASHQPLLCEGTGGPLVDVVEPGSGVSEVADEVDTTCVIAGIEHTKGCAAIASRLSGRCDCKVLGPKERAELGPVDEVMKRVRKLEDDQRAALADMIAEEVCGDCGAIDASPDGDEHECTAEDDDEDEEEDEDDDDSDDAAN